MAITNSVLDAQFNASRFRLQLAEAFKGVMERELKLAGQHLQRTITAYADQVTNGSAIKGVNQRLAEGMREATLTAYRQNVLQERVAPSYREDDSKRFAGGRLLRALEDPSMAVGTSYGIGFINTALLDSVAAQWFRLNFGASPGTGYSGVVHNRPNARVQFGSNQGFSLSLGESMGSGFRIPAGSFFGGAFFPTAKSWKKAGFNSKERSGGTRGGTTSGIRPRRFLDAGLVNLAENFGQAYKNFFADALREALSKERKTNITNTGRA